MSEAETILTENITLRLGEEGVDEDAIRSLFQKLKQEHPTNALVSRVAECISDYDEGQGREESDLPWIIFSLGGTAYAINSKHTLSIEILGKVTPVVDLHNYCPGIVPSRGEMIALLDLHVLFGSGCPYMIGDADTATMMIVAEVSGVKQGIIVDEIIAVEHISSFEDKAVSGQDGAPKSQYIEQIGKREKSGSPVLIIKPESIIVSQNNI